MNIDLQNSAVASEQESVGTILRLCRERRGLSINDAEEATKISKQYLLALEEDRHDDFPSQVYLKGFLKTYAVWLGLESEDLLRQAVSVDVAFSGETEKPLRRFTELSSFNWQRLVLPAGLFAALIISSFILSPSTPQRAVLPVQPTVPPVAAVPVAALQPAVSSAKITIESDATQSDKGATPAKPEELSPRPAQNGLLVSMKVARNSRLSVVIDDGAAQVYELTSGDLFEWKAERTIALDLSDAGSVELELNGKPLKLQAVSGKPTYLVLDGKGIRP